MGVIISNKALAAKRYYFVDFQAMRNDYVFLISLVLCIAIKYSSTKFLLVGIEEENGREPKERSPASVGRPALCNLNKESGDCFAAFPMFFFNKDSGSCQKFIYGGCGGNKNRFWKKKDCEKTCLAVVGYGDKDNERARAPCHEPWCRTTK